MHRRVLNVVTLSMVGLVLGGLGRANNLLADHPRSPEAARPAEVPTADVATLIAQLESPEFSLRRQAFLKLWQMGKPALELISPAKSSPTRRLAEAATVLEILIELEVAPEQLDESARLLDVIGNPTPQAIVELCGMKHWDVAERMLQANASLVEKFRDPYGRYLLSRLVDTALTQDDATLAWPIVRRVCSTPQAAWIAHQTGLPLEPPDPYAVAQQLYYDGNLEAALKLDLPAVVRLPMLTRSGRWSALLEEPYLSLLAGRQETPSQIAVRAVLTEVAGDLVPAEELWSEALKAPQVALDSAESTQADPNQSQSPADVDEPSSRDSLATEVAVKLLREIDQGGLGGQTSKYQLLAALLFSGRVAAIEQYLVDQDPAAAFSFFLAGNNHARAFEALGLQSDLSNFDEWLSKRKTMIAEGLSQRAPDNRYFDECARLCSTLSSLGLRQQSETLLDELVQLTRVSRGKQDELWSRSLLTWLGRSEGRQLAMQAAIAEFPQMTSECQAAVLKGLFPEFDQAAHALWNTAPGDSVDAKWNNLQRLYLFDRGGLGAGYSAIVSAWLQRAADSLAQEQLTSEQLTALANIANGFGDANLALKLLMSDLSPGLGQSTSVNLQWIDAARIFVQRGKPEEALPLFSAVRQTGSNPQYAYVDEVQALLLSGHFQQAKELEQARWLRPLATTRFFQGYNYLQAAREFSERQQHAPAAEYAQASFVLADLGSMDFYWAASEYGDILAELEQFDRKADVLRAAWVESMQPYASAMQYMCSNGYYSSLRFSAQKEKLARAVTCIAQGDLSGFQHSVKVARQLQPQDIEMVCQCYPLLIKAGEANRAKELFAVYEQDMQQQISQWPSDATALNNLAWMYTQCDLKLDEAMELSRRAVELAPASAIFLDTLAEVQFRSGDIESAVKTMRDCVRIDPRESHYRENLVRFRAQP